MVEPAADDAEEDGPGADVERLPRLAAARHEAAAGEPDGDDDADEDAQRVHPDRQRPEV